MEAVGGLRLAVSRRRLAPVTPRLVVRCALFVMRRSEARDLALTNR